MYNLIVRFPDEMQDALTAASKREERSINWLVVASVRRYLETQAPAPADTQSAHSESGAFVLPEAQDGRATQAASAGSR